MSVVGLELEKLSQWLKRLLLIGHSIERVVRGKSALICN